MFQQQLEPRIAQRVGGVENAERDLFAYPGINARPSEQGIEFGHRWQFVEIRRRIRSARHPLEMRLPCNRRADLLRIGMAIAHLRVALAIEQQAVGQVRHRHILRQTQPQVVILAVLVRAMIAADRAQGVAPHHHRRVAQRRPILQVVENRFRGRDVLEPPGVGKALGIDADASRAQHTDLRIGIEEGDLPRESFGQGDVVAVHARDQRCLRLGDDSVEAGDQPGVFLGNRPDSRIGSGESRDDRHRIVGRSVVHDQKLEVREALCTNAFNGMREIRGVVVHAHGNGNARFGHRKAQFSAPCSARDRVMYTLYMRKG